MKDEIKPVLKDDAVYFTDNGRILHGKCCGMSARYTGRDISGQKVMKVTPAIERQCREQYGFTPICETCGSA